MVLVFSVAAIIYHYIYQNEKSVNIPIRGIVVYNRTNSSKPDYSNRFNSEYTVVNRSLELQ